MKTPAYHKSLETLHVNCLEPRAYFIDVYKRQRESCKMNLPVRSLAGGYFYHYKIQRPRSNEQGLFLVPVTGVEPVRCLSLIHI